MKYTLRSDENPNISLCENDTVKSVLQNISTILSTRKGTVPLYRDFGLKMDYLDKPIDAVESLMASEISEAIENFEPRATLVDLKIESDMENPGKIAIILEVEIST